MPRRAIKQTPVRGSTSKARKKSPRNIRTVTKGNISGRKSQIFKSRKSKSQESHDDLFKERAVSARMISHWKPISKTSQSLLVQSVDSAIVSVLSHTSSSAYADVQDVLNNLKKRILDKTRNLRAPVTRRPEFSTLEAACQKLERDALETCKQEEQLSDMVDEMTRTVQEKEELLEELQKVDDGASTRKNGKEAGLHHLLQEQYDNKLGIPRLPKRQHTAGSLKMQIPEIKKLLDSFEGTAGLESITGYVMQLSNFVTLLPDDSKL